MQVPAVLTLDDDGRTINFDAVPFLRTATAEEIGALVACGWANDYPADAVAEYFEGVIDEITDALDNCRLVHLNNPEKGGYEVRIDGVAAENWLENNPRRGTVR